MNHLPVEVLLNLLSYMPKEELMTTVPQVCRRWNDVHTDPSLFRTLELANAVPDTAGAIRLLSIAPWLTSLQLSGRTDTDILVQHIGANHPLLVRLTLNKCRGNWTKRDVSAFHLRDLLRRCPRLQHFTLHKTHCDSDLWYQEIGLNLCELRVIEIASFQQVDSKAVTSFTDNCRRIEVIQIRDSGYNTVSENVVARFCDKFHESLSTVVLDNTLWTNTSLTSLTRCRNVRELNLRHAGNVTDEGIMSVCQLPNLESFTIASANNVTSLGWVRLFQNCSMKSLEKLSLSYGNIDDRVAEAISLLPNLEDLAIWGDQVTDEGLQMIANIPNLVHLRMVDNQQITATGWIRYFQTPQVQKMTHLWLCYCKNVNDQVVFEIAQNLRKLQQLQLSECSITPIPTQSGHPGW